jgi:uncharacterized protein with gpF-like domain
VLRDERVQAFVPLVEYSATKDSRTRPTHRAMDGYVNTMEMFDRQGLGPPGGFSCRCQMIPVSMSDAMENGWIDPRGNVDHAAIRRHNGSRQALIDSRQFPDPGFVNA